MIKLVFVLENDEIIDECMCQHVPLSGDIIYRSNMVGVSMVTTQYTVMYRVWSFYLERIDQVRIVCNKRFIHG